ncbi:MAG: oxidoreductase, partial [Pseudonocardiaceae bacterium]
DGSTVAITYATSGATGFPKETIDVLADGKVLRFDDFQRASVYGRKRWATRRLVSAQMAHGRDKGQRAQLDAFLDAIRSGGPMPFSVDSLVATTLATLAVGTSLAAGAPVRLERPAEAAAVDGTFS